MNKHKKISIIAILTLTFLNCGSLQSKSNKKPEPYYLTVIATAYCPCKKCCGKWADGKTKLGTDAKSAGVAVDPNVIPLGSHIDVPNYQRGPNKNGSWILCDDTGKKIKGNKIDLRFKTHQEALNWGIKKIKIRVHPAH
jgi:3D (Asp-Asp-Asp) domain-containing protein